MQTVALKNLFLMLEQKKILRRSVAAAFSFVKNIKTTGS